MKITIDNQLHLSEIPCDFEKMVRGRLTFSNPKYEEAERMNRWTGDIDPFLYFWQRTQDGVLILPRGYARQLIFLCRKHGVAYEVNDRRRTLPEVPFEFNGQLRDFQQDALDAVLGRDFGTLMAPTGAGKTVIGLGTIAARKQPTLVVVHTKELLNQWADRIETFLQIPRAEIGVIGGGKQTIGDRITVGLVQSLCKCVSDVAPRIGFLVVDECHRTPSRTFTEAVSAFDCRFMLGLSATPWRRDKLSRLIFWHLGDLVHEVDRQFLQDAGHILKADVVWRETNFQTSFDPTEEYSRMLSELTQDTQRNAQIAADVAHAAGNGSGTCLCLSDRKAHCETLSELLSGYGIEAPVLTGDTAKKERESIVERLNRGGIKVLCGTYQLLSEGFDSRELSTLFLGSPIKFDGRLIQVLGRILRPGPGKKAQVYDYVDREVSVLRAAARSRSKVYEVTS